MNPLMFLLDSCEEYDERRRVRMRLKALMAEKKELQKQLSGHEQGDLYSSSRRTTGVSGSKGSDVRTSEGELESLILKKLQSSLRQGKGPFNNSFSSNGGVHVYSALSSTEKSSKNLIDSKLFLESIRNNLKKYMMEEAHASGKRNSDDLSTDFIVEVSSVLDKLKTKIEKSKSQAVIPDSNENAEEGEQLVSLIDKLKSSLGSVLESENTEQTGNGHIEKVIDSNTPDDNLDADDEDDSDLGDDDVDSEDDECETETVETVQTAIFCNSEYPQSNNKVIGKKTQKENENNDCDEDAASLSSSEEHSNDRRDGRQSSSESTSSKHALQRQPSRDEARSYLSSAIVKCKSREELVKGSEDYVEGRESFDRSDKQESSPEIDGKEKDNVKKKDMKDLPWKIRVAKKRIEHTQSREEVPYNVQKNSSSESSSPSFVPLTQRRNSMEAVTNSKPRPYMAGTPIQSKSAGDVTEMINEKHSRDIHSSQSLSYRNGNHCETSGKARGAQQSEDSDESDGDDEGQVFSIKQSDETSALRKQLPGIYHNQHKSYNKPFALLSKVEKKDVIKKSELYNKGVGEHVSDDADEKYHEEEEVLKADSPKADPQNDIPGIYHNQWKPPANKSINLLQKLDKKEVLKKSEMFTKASESVQQPQLVQHKPVDKVMIPKKVKPYEGHTFKPFVPGSALPSTAQMQLDSSFITRPTTLHLRSKVPDCRPNDFEADFEQNYGPPLPAKGEILRPPPLPNKSSQAFNNFGKPLVTSKSQDRVPYLLEDNLETTNAKPFMLSRSKSSPMVIKEPYIINAVNKKIEKPKGDFVVEVTREKITQALKKPEEKVLKPVFTYSDKTVKTNMVSQLQNKFEVHSQNSDTRLNSNPKSIYSEKIASEVKSHKDVSEDPSSMLFTEEQLVKIAIHKAAINKQLSDGEHSRKNGIGRTKSVTEQFSTVSAAPFRRVNSIAGPEIGANYHYRGQEIEQHLNQRAIEQQVFDQQKSNEQVRFEKQRREQMTFEQQKIEQERIEQHLREQLKKEHEEKLYIEKQKLENQRIEQHRLEQQRLEALRKEHHRIEQERLEKQRIEQQRIEQLRIEEEKLEQQRLERQRLEKQRIEQQMLEKQRIEQQRLEQQRYEQYMQEQMRIEQQRLEQQRIENERIEKERIERQKLEQQRKEQLRIEQEKLEQQRKEQAKAEMLLKQQQFFEQQRKEREQKIQNQKITFVAAPCKETKRIQEMFEKQTKQEVPEQIQAERAGRSQNKKSFPRHSIGGLSNQPQVNNNYGRSLSAGRSGNAAKSMYGRGSSLGGSRESVNSEEEVFYDALSSSNFGSPKLNNGIHSAKETTSKPLMRVLRDKPFSSSLSDETLKRVTQSPETQKVYKAQVQRTNSLVERNTRKISLQNNELNQSPIQAPSWSLRTKSSSISALPDPNPSLPYSESFINQDLKTKSKFVVPHLPTTSTKPQQQRQLQQSYPNHGITPKPLIPNQSNVSKWGSVPDNSVSKQKITDFYVPPLPTTDFKKVNDKKFDRTKAFNVRTQSLTSLNSESYGTSLPGALEIITEKETEESLGNQGKVASKWESAISSSDKIITSVKPWNRGPTVEMQGQYVQRSKELLLKNKSDEPVSTEIKTPKVFKQVKQNKASFVSHKMRKMFKEKVKKWESDISETERKPKQQWERVGENIYVNATKKKPKKWEKVAENIYRDVSQDQHKSKFKKWETLVKNNENNINDNFKENRKRDLESSVQSGKKWEKFIENKLTSGMSAVPLTAKVHIPEKDRVIMRIKENKFDNSNAELFHSSSDVKVNRLSKDIIELFNSEDKSGIQTKPAGFVEHVRKMDKTYVGKVFDNGCTENKEATSWKMENLNKQSLVKRELAKFESGFGDDIDYIPHNEIRRSRSGIIKSNIAAFVQNYSDIEPSKYITVSRPVVQSGSLVVKRNLDLFENSLLNVPEERRPLPIRSSKSAVFGKGFSVFSELDTAPAMRIPEKRRSGAEKYSKKIAALLEQLESPNETPYYPNANEMSLKPQKRPQNLEFYPAANCKSEPQSSTSKLLPWGKESPKRISPTTSTVRHGQFEPSLSKDSIDQKRKEMESFFSQPGGNKVSEIYKLSSKQGSGKVLDRTYIKEIESKDSDSDSWENLLSDTDYNNTLVDEMFSETLLRDININESDVNEKISSLSDINISPIVDDVDSPLDVFEPVFSSVRVSKSQSFAEFSRSKILGTQSNSQVDAANYLANRLPSFNVRPFNPAVGNASYSYNEDSEDSDSSTASSDTDSDNLGTPTNSSINLFDAETGTTNVKNSIREFKKKKSKASYCSLNRQRTQSVPPHPSFNALFMARHSQDRFTDTKSCPSEQSLKSDSDEEWADEDISSSQFKRFETVTDDSLPCIEITDLDGLLSVPSGNICPTQKEVDSSNCERLTVRNYQEIKKQTLADPKLLNVLKQYFSNT